MYWRNAGRFGTDLQANRRRLIGGDWMAVIHAQPPALGLTVPPKCAALAALGALYR